MTAGLGSVWFKKSFMENRGISYVLSAIMDESSGGFFWWKLSRPKGP